MKYFLLLILSAIHLSCEHQETISHFDVILEIDDYDSILYSNKSLITSVIDINIADSILIIKNMNNDHSFSFININNGQIVCNWGAVGKGPYEYLSISNKFSIANNRFIFLDINKKEVNSVLISDIINIHDTIDIVKETIPYDVDFRPRYLNILKNHKILIGSFNEKRFGVLDETNNIVESSYNYPFECDQIEDVYMGSVFQSQIESSMKQSRFVISTLSSDIFEIYEMTGSSIRRLYVSPFQYVPKTKSIPERKMFSVDYKNSIAGIMEMAVSDELICFTYSTQTYDDAAKRGLSSNEILCFDWSGNKIKKYILPCEVSSFCIDQTFIYGVRELEEEIIIYRFKMI